MTDQTEYIEEYFVNPKSGKLESRMIPKPPPKYAFNLTNPKQVIDPEKYPKLAKMTLKQKESFIISRK